LKISVITEDNTNKMNNVIKYLILQLKH